MEARVERTAIEAPRYVPPRIIMSRSAAKVIFAISEILTYEEHWIHKK
jgi:hypothetical protein